MRYLVGMMIAVAALLAACDSPLPPPVPEPEPSPVVSAMPLPSPTRAPTPGPLELVYWEEDDDQGGVVLDELAAQFVARTPGVVVRRVHQSFDDVRSGFRAQVAAGKGPDLVRAPGEFAGPFGELGVAMPLDDVFSTDYLDQFFPGALAGAKSAGRLVALPDNYGSNLVLLYNRALAPTPPADTESWIAQMKTLTDPASGRWGVVFPAAEAYWLVPWLGGFGGWPLDAQDRPVLDTPEMVEALWFVRDLAEKHAVMPPAASYEQAFDLFRQGQAAYIVDGLWNLDRYQGLGIDIGVAVLPEVSETGLDPIPMARGRYWFVNSSLSGERLARAVDFAEHMSGPAAQSYWLDKMGRLPSNREVAAGPAVTGDPIRSQAMAQLARSRAVPPAIEMACAWQGIAAALPDVARMALAPEDAAPAMQAAAMACLAEMTGEPTPEATPTASVGSP